jgi:hypothetical protein
MIQDGSGSVDIGGPAGLKHCMVEHVGLVISGKAVAAMEDGQVVEMNAGDLFYIAVGPDSWVVSDEPDISLHFMGAADYAKHQAVTGRNTRCLPRDQEACGRSAQI